ncbi:hypothetical protein SUGI_0253310 [Cryptomeria japonica]|uniref:transmembrane E3 ubiquitin-protein ligase FLY2 n=1 Tax=Cryptomeria japonica TaxID=3369 RepID=UPI002408BA0D|nr:transmembrane E3 ubiquitin-protein ligase FLY2 [Cryptomeria japonica]GLJ15429.1 hypothetical protein SUGI_0253310 [Cryptomeria japonica]
MGATHQKQNGSWRRGYRCSAVLMLIMQFLLSWPLEAFRPLTDTSWGDQHLFSDRIENALGPFSMWNISGTYRGTWGFQEAKNGSSRLPNFRKSSGQSVFELVSSPTKIYGVHYVQGAIVFKDGSYIDEHDSQIIQMRMEGVYIWPFRQLRMVANSGTDGDNNQEELILSSPYHMLGIFSSQVLQESPRDQFRRKGNNDVIADMERHCNLQIAAHISQISTNQKNEEHEHYHMEGVVESPMIDDDGECFSPIILNATSINVEVYYNKAVNYTLMVTFVSFLQVLLLIRQMEHSNTQSGAAKVSLLMIGQQAIMDAYLCLLHLTAGILVESLFNAFATAAFFKFVVFSIFEMRYLLAIWKARRPMNTGEVWETMRRELSVLYSHFYGVLLGGIIIMYEFHTFLRSILLVLYSFWLPQIITNIIRDTRKPLHPHYIVGMTLTRLAVPLYAFGCPRNFMRVDIDIKWCICLTIFLGFQALILLLQHYLGARWFIPRQILPEKYSYFRRADRDSNHVVDCVICMAAVDTVQRASECMITPCDHFFHAGCLQRWMDIKMECPTCRRPLPPV